MTKPDMVNHPPHYTAHPSGVECIQITQHMGFCLGNAFKYIWRANQKGGVEDLRKAELYLRRQPDVQLAHPRVFRHSTQDLMDRVVASDPDADRRDLLHSIFQY